MVIKHTTQKLTVRTSGTSGAIAVPALKNRMTKAQVFTHLAEITKLAKKQVTQVFEALSDLVRTRLKKK